MGKYLSVKYFLVFLMLTACQLSYGKNSTLVEFLGGCWVSEDGTSKEVWSTDNEKIMFGYSYVMNKGDVKFFEQLHIIKKDNQLLYVASILGQETTMFYAVEDSPHSVRFENSEHDYPQVIIYKRAGNVLEATISLLDGTKPHTFRKFRCSE